MLSLRTLLISSKAKTDSIFTGINNQDGRLKELYQVYASLPQTIDTFQTTIQATDARSEIARQYLQKYKSPLAPYADVIVAISEQYKTDKVNDLWRYIIAIAQCESNLGTKIPQGSYNAWGLGIPTGAKNGLSFNSWPEGINSSAKFLRKLIDRNLLTPEEWAPIYAPPSVQNGGSWEKCVHHFLDGLL